MGAHKKVSHRLLRLYPALFRISIVVLLIISLFLIMTSVSFRVVSLAGAGSPYSLTHSYTQEILPSYVGAIYFFHSITAHKTYGAKLERMVFSATLRSI